MADRPIKTIAEVCSDVVDCPHSTPKWTESGVVVLRSRNIRGGRLDLAAQPSFTTEADFKKRVKRAAPRAGDLVITREAPMGEVCMIPPGLRCCLGQRMVLLRPDDARMDGRYLLFALQSPEVQHQIRAHEGTGSTVSNLRIPALESLGIPAPPLDEQRRIAAVLGALDDKIELNRKMNRTLEEMAQAIFKSWFIDFDGHNDLVDSEIGPVPRGWEVGSPDAFVEFDPTIPLRKGTDAVYADMKAIPTSGPAVSEWTRRAYAGGTRFQQGDTLLARITPCLENGKSALVDFLADGEVAFGSTEFIVLRPRPGVPRVWPYCLVRHEPFRAHAIANMTGSSGRQRVSAGALLGFRLAVPPAEVLRRFGAVSDPLFERITANTRESTTLASLRDALLPKLISGELRVPEAEALVEAAS
jgi:type I restriction enzyme, S subunit